MNNKAQFLSDLRLIPTEYDPDRFMLSSPLRYYSLILDDGELEESGVITVPAFRFTTDLATIPRLFRWLFRPDGPWKRAAVIHDYLIAKKFPRVLADRVFLEALKADDIDLFTRYIFFFYVRLNAILKGIK